MRRILGARRGSTRSTIAIALIGVFVGTTVVVFAPFPATSARASATTVATPTTATSAATNPAPVVPCPTGANAIVCENLQTGTDPAIWDVDGAGDPGVQGFSTDISVNVGGQIDFKIDSEAAEYTVDIYRTGWYDGKGARFIDDVIPTRPTMPRQPQCARELATELFDCGTWGVSASWHVPATAVSGVYVALLTRTDTGGKSHITFIVRDEASTSDIVFQTSDPTWQAYNTYGGSDFYQGAANGRAYKLSYNRPLATRGDNSGRDSYFGAEYPLARFLEKQGYDVTYQSGVDTDRFGSLLLNHDVFLSVGHDEYWSTGQRANVEAARDAGVNLQFLSGNEAYWHTRWESSGGDTGAAPYRTLVSYKDTWGDRKIDDSNPTWTGTWRDPRFASPANGAGKPENALTGTAYMANHDDLAVTVTAAQGKMRMWRNTGLAGMTGPTQALAPHTVGYESNEDVDNGFRPSGLVRMSRTEGATPQYLQDFGTVVAPGTTTHTITLYRATSGALVFSAGSIQWTWGLDQEHDGNGALADQRMQQAQVNLLADMGAQPHTLTAPLVAAAKTTDSTPPVTTVTSPTPGSALQNGATVTMTGTASDTSGLVAGVNVSTDNGKTWRAATGTTSWSYTYTQHGRGATPVLVRAIDDSGNYAATPTTATYQVGGPFSVLGAQVPLLADAGDNLGRQLGLTFTPTVDGFVSGVRFYKSAGNTGAHTGTLWSTDGVRLATAAFTSETATGWQQTTFTPAVAVTAGTKYVVSYFAPNGHYAASTYQWISRGWTAPPLTVAGGYEAPSAGVYGDGDTFPASQFKRANYFVDAVFDVVDPTPLVVMNRWPVDGSTSNSTTTAISATLTRAVAPESVAFHVERPDGTTVPGTTTYTAADKSVSFQPTGALAAATKYTVSFSATTTSGMGVSSGGTWSFTTATSSPPPGVCPCSLYTDSTVPGVLRVTENSGVTLGVRFSSTQAGTISGLRFYKNADNTGEHVGTLWSATGQVLATATFGAESTAGWQTVNFATPVDIAANTVYVATYRAPTGRYSATVGEYSSAYSHGPLQVAASGGTYTYGTGFPTANTTSGYLVDAVFTPTVVPLTVVSRSPSDGATTVPRDSTISITLSGAVKPGYSLTASSGGAAIAGTTALSADAKTITFTPSAPLPNAAAVQATLSGAVSTQGATLASQTWGFTTLDSGTTTVQTLFGVETPAVAAAADGDAVELGVGFTPAASGSATAIRFYKGAGNGGTHVGHLWTSTGGLLATVTFEGESASGWQTANLSAPVALQAGQNYVVSYLAPQGHYSLTQGYFSAAKTSGQLTAGAANNGRFRYGAAGGFPTGSWGSSNYFVDVVVAFASGGSTPPPGTPATPTGTGLFGSETPAVASTPDDDPIELGVSFTPSVAGTATSVRFYKGAGNLGQHLGHVWSSTGQLLGTAQFANETASGWQTAQLGTAVQLAAGQTYVVSYFAPQGHYSYTSGYFATAKTTGPLTAAATTNGRYAYALTGGYPTSTYGNTNYFVDVGFTPTP
jgi:hypothetical protein